LARFRKNSFYIILLQGKNFIWFPGIDFLLNHTGGVTHEWDLGEWIIKGYNFRETTRKKSRCNLQKTPQGRDPAYNKGEAHMGGDLVGFFLVWWDHEKQ